ncbi:general substrate transporter [Choanephora cucurbitarum]|nr:general substrate transporter [Choanephora cucurbitarum]
MGNSFLLYGVCAFAAIGGFLFGYDTGVISSILTMNRFQLKMAGVESLTSLQEGTITGLLLAGCFVGSLLAAPSAERFSRKITIIIGTGVFMVGAALQCGANGYAMMVIGRAEIRGRLIALQQLMCTAGIMVAFWVGVGTDPLDSDAQWRIPLGVQIAPAIVLFFGAMFLPYSPRWLVSKGRNAEALEVLAKLHGNGDQTDPRVVGEYEDIVAQIELERSVAVGSYVELLKPKLRRRLVLGVLTQIFQQFTGINSIMYYAPTIFSQAGIGAHSATLIASGVNGVLNMFATIPAVLYVDRFGRRKILISGALFMAAAMLLCGIVMAATGKVTFDEATGKHGVDMSGNINASYFCIVMIYFFVAGFAYSWGPVGWIYPAEIYPLSVRAKGTSITTSANWLFNFVISEICPVMLASITWGTYIFFGCCCIIMSVVVYVFFPETKGKSLEEMDMVFGGSVFAFKNQTNISEEITVASDEKKGSF